MQQLFTTYRNRIELGLFLALAATIVIRAAGFTTFSYAVVGLCALLALFYIGLSLVGGLSAKPWLLAERAGNLGSASILAGLVCALFRLPIALGTVGTGLAVTVVATFVLVVGWWKNSTPGIFPQLVRMTLLAGLGSTVFADLLALATTHF